MYKKYLLEHLSLQNEIITTVSLKNTFEIQANFLKQRYTFIKCDSTSIVKIHDYMQRFTYNEFEVIMAYKLKTNDEIIEQINIFNSSYKAFDTTQPYCILIVKI